MSKLELNFLGQFGVSHRGIPVTGFESSKVRALLAYLAVEAARPHSREALAAFLWPEWPDSAARSNLRYALADLRKNLHDQQAEPPFLLISRETIQFNTGSNHCLDVVEFSNFAADSKSSVSSDEQLARLQQALSLFRGDFLDGFSLPDAAPFEDWVRLKREQLHRQHMQVLSDLASAYERGGDLPQALTYAWRQVEIEPWQESSQRQLMRLLALDGQRSAALAQFEACRKVLLSELQVEPGSETVRLYESIRDGTLDAQVGAAGRIEELPPAPGVPPFKGLQYFGETDASLYFGREALASQLVNRLGDLNAGRFLAVVGASGSGKSSLLRAGLVPALRHGERLDDGTLPPRWSHRWLVHVITPTAHPLESLATSLTREAGPVSTTAALIDDMARDPRSLHLYALRMTHLRSAPRLLLVVDQFEELFTLCRSESERSAFVENLLIAAGIGAGIGAGTGPEVDLTAMDGEESSPSINPIEDGPVLAVVALRADFYGHCAQYASLRSALSAQQEFIGPMSSEELRRAIVEPARQNEWEFEPGLVDLILREVSDEPGGLPLLSHALLETWSRRRGRILTLKGYAEAGGIHGAIAQTAESVYNGLSPDKRGLARRIFLRLTELGEGTQDTRRRASLTELTPAPEAAAQIEGVLNTLVEARLVTAGEGTVEVAHEALIREWPALRQWLDEDRESLRLHRHLTEAAQAWESMGRDTGELYRGARLAQAVEWARHPENLEALNVQEREFLAASEKLEAEMVAEREAQQRRELEAAQRAAEAERLRAEEQARSAARLRRRALYLVGALLLALVMAGMALEFGNRSAILAAENAVNAAYASTQQAIAEAEAAGRATQQAVAESAAQTALEAQSEAQAQAALARQQAEVISIQEAEAQRSAEINHSLALAAQSQLARQSGNQDLALTLALYAIDLPNPPTQAEMALSLAAYDPGTVRVFSGHQGPVESLAISPDGRYALSGAGVDEEHPEIQDFNLRLWDVSTGDEIRQFKGHTGGITKILFTPDGRSALSASLDHSLILWDVHTGEIVRRISNHGAPVKAIDISTDGRFALSSSGVASSPETETDISIRLWDLANGTEIRQLGDGSQEISGLAFLPDGRKALTGSIDGTLTLWDLETGQIARRPDGTESVANIHDYISSIDIDPNGNRAALGSRVSLFSVVLWDLESWSETGTIEVQTATVNHALFSPDGDKLVTSNFAGGPVQVWDVGSGDLLHSFSGHAGGTHGVDFTPDGQYILSASDDKTLRLWALEYGAVIHRYPHDDRVRDVAYNPVDSRFVLSSEPAALNLWDLEKREEIRRMPVEGDQSGVVYSPNGKEALSAVLFDDVSEGEPPAAVIQWDIESGEEIKRLLPGSPGTQFAVYSPDGRLALSGGETAILWDLSTGEALQRFEHFTNSVAFSPDGRTALLGGDLNVYWCDLETGEVLQELKGHTGVVWDVAFLPDRKIALSGSWDGTLILWDLQTGSILRHLIDHTAEIHGVAVSPDGRMAISASADGTLILWDLESGQAIRRYYGHAWELRNVAFSPDGLTAVSAGRDMQMIHWRIDRTLEELVAWTRSNRHVRDLTCTERELYAVEPLCDQ